MTPLDGGTKFALGVGAVAAVGIWAALGSHGGSGSTPSAASTAETVTAQATMSPADQTVVTALQGEVAASRAFADCSGGWQHPADCQTLLNAYTAGIYALGAAVGDDRGVHLPGSTALGTPLSELLTDVPVSIDAYTAISPSTRIEITTDQSAIENTAALNISQ